MRLDIALADLHQYLRPSVSWMLTCQWEISCPFQGAGYVAHVAMRERCCTCWSARARVRYLLFFLFLFLSPPGALSLARVPFSELTESEDLFRINLSWDLLNQRTCSGLI